MALTYRFYRTRRIGTGGLIPNPKEPGSTTFDAYRSALDTYITIDGTGQAFWDWIHDARPVRYALALCESAKHTILVADPDIQPLSPELSTVADVTAWLDGLFAPDSATAGTILESDGCSIAWTSVGTTRRAVLRYLAHVHVMTQEGRRRKDPDLLRLFSELLESRVNELPIAVRQKIATWMQSKGLDTSWITGTTRLRQVIHFLRENVTWPDLRLGPVVL